MGAMRSSPSLFLFLCNLLPFSIGRIKSRGSLLCVWYLCGLSVCLFVLVCTCACKYLCVWRLRVEVEHLPQLFSTVFFEASSLTECGSYEFDYTCWPMSPRDLLVSTFQHLDYRCISLYLHSCHC